MQGQTYARELIQWSNDHMLDSRKDQVIIYRFQWDEMHDKLINTKCFSVSLNIDLDETKVGGSWCQPSAYFKGKHEKTAMIKTISGTSNKSHRQWIRLLMHKVT